MGTQESDCTESSSECYIADKPTPAAQSQKGNLGSDREGTRTSSPMPARQRVSQVSTGPVSQARMHWSHGRDHTMQAARCSWLPGLAQGKWQQVPEEPGRDIDQGHWRGFWPAHIVRWNLLSSDHVYMANLFKILRKIFTTIWESLFEKMDGEATLTTSAWKYQFICKYLAFRFIGYCCLQVILFTYDLLQLWKRANRNSGAGHTRFLKTTKRQSAKFYYKM